MNSPISFDNHLEGKIHTNIKNNFSNLSYAVSSVLKNKNTIWLFIRRQLFKKYKDSLKNYYIFQANSVMLNNSKTSQKQQIQFKEMEIMNYDKEILIKYYKSKKCFCLLKKYCKLHNKNSKFFPNYIGFNSEIRNIMSKLLIAKQEVLDRYLSEMKYKKDYFINHVYNQDYNLKSLISGNEDNSNNDINIYISKNLNRKNEIKKINEIKDCKVNINEENKESEKIENSIDSIIKLINIFPKEKNDKNISKSTITNKTIKNNYTYNTNYLGEKEKLTFNYNENIIPLSAKNLLKENNSSKNDSKKETEIKMNKLYLNRRKSILNITLSKADRLSQLKIQCLIRNNLNQNFQKLSQFKEKLREKTKFKKYLSEYWKANQILHNNINLLRNKSTSDFSIKKNILVSSLINKKSNIYSYNNLNQKRKINKTNYKENSLEMKIRNDSPFMQNKNFSCINVEATNKFMLNNSRNKNKNTPRNDRYKNNNSINLKNINYNNYLNSLSLNKFPQRNSNHSSVSIEKLFNSACNKYLDNNKII